MAPGGTPALAMLANPVEQSALKADVATETLGFEPLVLQDLLPLGEELLIEARLLHKFT